ncbi:MAG: Gfo/Idh/MocA family protein [bacterium]
MEKKKVNVGLIGYKFMGKSHSHAYHDVAMFFDDLPLVPVMKAICGRDEAGVKAAQEKFGWESYETDWRKLIARDDIDVVDISSPGNTHKEIVVEAAKAGKHIICEKPLANTLDEAKEMVKAVQKAGVKHMVAFNYRRVPAIALAKQLIDQGRIGKIYHFRGVYLQDWIMDPNFPLVWRLNKKTAGSGALGDIGAHVIDLARYLVGDFDRIVGMTETFIKERPIQEAAVGDKFGAKAGRERGKVDVDDAALLLVRFKNGAVGSIEATRFANGRRNYNCFEINGSEGSLTFNLEDMNRLGYLDSREPKEVQGFRSILVTEDSHPYIGAWWPAGHIIGWEHTFIHEVRDFLNCIADDKMPSPNFEDGLKVQEVLDAVERSAKEEKWIKIK